MSSPRETLCRCWHQTYLPISWSSLLEIKVYCVHRNSALWRTWKYIYWIFIFLLVLKDGRFKLVFSSRVQLVAFSNYLSGRNTVLKKTRQTKQKTPKPKPNNNNNNNNKNNNKNTTPCWFKINCKWLQWSFRHFHWLTWQEPVHVLAQVHPDAVIPLLVTGHLLHLYSFVNTLLGSSPPTFMSTHDFIVC